jgi:hypothetical protein
MIAQGFYLWGALWGDPWSQRLRWMDHNPFDKVDKLRGTLLYVSNQLTAHNIPVTKDYYGPGTHTWPYWERAVRRSWPLLAQGMGL